MLLPFGYITIFFYIKVNMSLKGEIFIIYEYKISMKKEIMERVENIGIYKRYVFILMLLGRQVKVYEKASKNREWNRSNELNKIIKVCWESLIRRDTIEENMIDECNECDPENIGSDGDDIEGFCNTTVDNITVLIELMVAGEDIDKAFLGCNYAYLDSFIDQYYGGEEINTKFVEEHELMKLEYERCIRDLDIIEKNEEIKDIFYEYQEFKKESILQHFWFKENFE